VPIKLAKAICVAEGLADSEVLMFKAVLSGSLLSLRVNHYTKFYFYINLSGDLSFLTSNLRIK
jgi:hypothetical protein